MLRKIIDFIFLFLLFSILFACKTIEPEPENISYSVEIVNEYKEEIIIEKKIWDNPFGILQDYVDLNGGWKNHKEESRIFHSIKKELGDDFFEQLILYVNHDSEKIYWCTLFLEAYTFLHGNEPETELVYKVFEVCLPEFISNPTKKMPYNKLSKYLTLTIQYSVKLQKRGETQKAYQAKRIYEDFLKKNKNYINCFPAFDTEEQAIYESI